MKYFNNALKAIQIVGVGLGAAVLTAPQNLSGIIPPRYVPTLLAASAIINAFAPSLVKTVQQKRDELFKDGAENKS